MGDIGFPEFVVVLVVALLVFGPGRLPETGRSVGRALRELRQAIRGDLPGDRNEVKPGLSPGEIPADRLKASSPKESP
jgi:sec-independent protein translocase protein TatA